MTHQKTDHEKEFKLLKSLNSPYLIQLFGENFKFDGFYCFVTELCEVEKIKNSIKFK